MSTTPDERLPDEGLWQVLEPRRVPYARVLAVADERLAKAGDQLSTVYFPVDAIVLIARQTASDSVPLTVSLIGREGLVGWPALLDIAQWSHDVRVVSAGELLAVKVPDLLAACAAHPLLHRLLLRVTHNHAMQLAQSVVANLGHSVERRVARWLTLLHDRTTGDRLGVTHDQLARLLNVRRATVTDTLHVLEGERLLRNTRGQIEIRNRDALEARAAQSYGLSERDYNASIGPFGKSSTIRQP